MIPKTEKMFTRKANLGRFGTRVTKTGLQSRYDVVRETPVQEIHEDKLRGSLVT
jgi:hypothetical protein